MEMTGKVVAVLQPKSGVSAKTGNQWVTQQFVIETEGQYPKHVCFDVFGEDKIKLFIPQVGATVKVSFDIDAREYNGKYFNKISAYKVEMAGAAQQSVVYMNQPVQQQYVQQTMPPQQAQINWQQQQQQQQQNSDGLPF